MLLQSQMLSQKFLSEKSFLITVINQIKNTSKPSPTKSWLVFLLLYLFSLGWNCKGAKGKKPWKSFQSGTEASLNTTFLLCHFDGIICLVWDQLLYKFRVVWKINQAFLMRSSNISAPVWKISFSAVWSIEIACFLFFFFSKTLLERFVDNNILWNWTNLNEKARTNI